MALRLKTFSSLLFSYDKQCVTTVLFRSKHKKSQNDKESAPIKKSLSKEEQQKNLEQYNKKMVCILFLLSLL